MTTSDPWTAPASARGPRPTPSSESVKEKKDLASWWKTFKRSEKKPENQAAPQGIFGVPLQQSIRYANVAISLFNDEGQSYIYGYVPIVVAKCGVFLKEKATDVEGIFRLAGSEKRIKELKVAFNSPDRYGKGLDWTGYTVHDAANILRRYFNQLPEPIIPLEFYQRFREPLRHHQAQAVGHIDTQGPSEGDFDHEAAIRAYQALITELPPLNRQLLLYILDLLAVFASKSDLNKMTTPNLAAIFQPGILSHPQHDMAPQEYRLSQDVLIFLIENQDNFLIGMQGTAADPDTVREVQTGATAKLSPSPPTPVRSRTLIGRSGSNSSVAAESVRRWGSMRRNVSVSSKHSKRSENAPPPSGSPVPGTPVGGVHRSNTVPSRRQGSTAHSRRFSREKQSDPMTPNAAAASSEPKLIQPSTLEHPGSIEHTPVSAPLSTPIVPAALEVTSASSSEAATPLAGIANESSRGYHTPKKDTTPLLMSVGSSDKSDERSASQTPTTTSGRKFLDILKQSPGSDGETRKPNKLQKKRQPGSSLSSAQSSSHDLHADIKEEHQRSPFPASVAPASKTDVQLGTQSEPAHPAAVQTPSPATPAPFAPVPAAPSQGNASRSSTDATLRPHVSPSNSFRSHTDQSDADLVGDDMPAGDEPEKKKRSRWRFSRSQNNVGPPSTPGSNDALVTISAREQATSRSTLASGGSHPRKSLQQETTPIAAAATDAVAEVRAAARTEQVSMSSYTSDTVFSDSERERKGPMSWLRNKLQERKDKETEKRSATPERGHRRAPSRQDLQTSPEGPGGQGNKSLEQQRIVWDASHASAAAESASTAPLPPVDSAPSGTATTGNGGETRGESTPGAAVGRLEPLVEQHSDETAARSM